MAGNDQVWLREASRRMQLQVAIDGPAGAGKSTVGRAVAAVLGCPYLDTGLMYRVVTMLTELERAGDKSALDRLLEHASFNLAQNGDSWDLRLNGKPLPHSDLRSSGVESRVGEVSKCPAVRRHLVTQQRNLARDRCIVMLGRDIGTVVLPDAQVKLYITASPEVRVSRRKLERRAAGDRYDDVAIVADLRARDIADSTRAISPLRVAHDATVIDTENIDACQATQLALDRIRGALDLGVDAVHG